MPLATPRYTLQDLDSFPDDGSRYELLDGLLLVTPAPAPGHQAVVSRLCRTISGYVDAAVAEVYSPGSVEIEPNVHLEPDILVVPRTEPIGKRWSDIATWWLAVEVSGTGSRVYDRDFKHAAYSALGVREVWRIDLKDRCAVVSSLSFGQEQTYYERFEWHPRELVEPVVIDVPALFEGIQANF